MSDPRVYHSKTELLRSIIKPLPAANHATDCPFRDLERMLEGYEKNWGLNLDPDFQRGHVWTAAQRIAYLEGIYRGTVGESQRTIQFNAPHWETEDHGGDLPNEIQILDGLQRLTTVRMFMAGKLRIFNGLHVDDFEGSNYSTRMAVYRLRFTIHNFAWRKDVLQWYISVNEGGSPHAPEEIDRVKALLAITGNQN